MRLTFGNEIECLLVRDTQPRYADDLQDLMIGREIVHGILSQPLTTKCSNDCTSAALGFHLPLHPVSLRSQPYDKWKVRDDSLQLMKSESNALTQKEKVAVYEIEVISRVLGTADDLEVGPSKTHPDHTHKVKAFDELLAVYHRLGKAFNADNTDPNWRLLVNETAGSHVHIGDGPRGFTMPCLRNLLSLMVANEPAIDSLHTVDRITGFLPFKSCGKMLDLGLEKLAGEGYNTPWSAIFLQLAMRQREKLAIPAQFPSNRFDKFLGLRDASTRTDVPSWMKIIRCVQSLRDLGDLQRDSENERNKDGTVNFNNLKEHGPDNTNWVKMTVEFRQHAGTLRGPEILAWTQFLVSLMTYCNDTPEDDVDRLCMKAWSDPSWTALDLMKAIGMSQESDPYKHYKHILGFSPKSKPYADIVRKQEIKALRLHGPDVFAKMMNVNIENRYENQKRANVEKRVIEKFLQGCYGQYEDGYLRQLSLTREQRVRLTVGWTPGRSADSCE